MKKAIPITIILLGLGLYVYFFHVRPANTFDPIVRGSGTIEALEVSIAPKIPAHIKTISVEEGTSLSAGTLLVTLGCEDIEARVAQAEAQVLQAQAMVRQAEAVQAQSMAASTQVSASVRPLLVGKERAERELGRAQRLSSVEGVTQRTLDEAETAVKTVTEQISAAEKGVAVSGQAVTVASRAVETARAQMELAERAVDVAKVALRECTLYAPISGTVTARNYEPGEMVLPGSPILKVAALGDVYTWIYVANEEVGKLRLGQQVRVAADTYAGRIFEGIIVRINEKAEFTPKSIQTKEDRTRLVYGVKVSLPNSDRALMPGMPVEAVFEEGAPQL